MLNEQNPPIEFVNNAEKVENTEEKDVISEEDLQVLKEMQEDI